MCPPPPKLPSHDLNNSSNKHNKMNSDSSRNNNTAAAASASASAGKTTSRETNILKEVKFDQVFIHEFPIILGDNPAVSKGAPITIDWKPITHDVIDLDIYEYLREPERRHRKRMIMSNSKRAKLLMNAGYSIDDIAEMTLQVEDAKRVRAENALDSNNSLTNSAWFQNMKNGNIMELLSGAAEGTGRTLFIAAPTAVIKGANKVGYEVVKGTGKVVVGTGKATTAVVVGTGKLVATTGKVSADLAVGTVKGTGKVVVGAGKATTAVVVGTGKLGYDVVRSSGKLMSNLFNGSIVDLGYENPDGDNSNEAKDDPLSLRSSTSNTYRRGSNDSRDSRDRRSSLDGAETYAPTSSIGKGTPAPQRMPRRGSANNYANNYIVSKNGSTTSEEQQANTNSRSNKGSSGSNKSKRRGSGSGALAGSFSNFTNIFTGRGVRRTNSSTPVRGSGGADNNNNNNAMDGSSRIRTKSSDRNNSNKSGGRRRRATMTGGGPISPRLTKSANAATAMQNSGGFSELAQMEQFLNLVRDSEPSTVNPIIGNAYTSASSADDDYDTPSDDEDDISGSNLGGSGGSASGSGSKTTRRNSMGSGNNTSSSSEKALSPASAGEAITPAA